MPVIWAPMWPAILRTSIVVADIRFLLNELLHG
jgi:hypothetical protein